ncbi:MAG TPA: sigma-70 family RNA polymerase sigma factor, partial [Polyangiaceae bacterium]|nr:sigma-70 family RNA polymerase sigma factor [Polyangiaceae bacterium]
MAHSPEQTSCDEGALILKVAEGDVASYRELVKRHAARLVRFATRLLRDASEAEDVVQESFLRLWLRASEYSDKASGSAWLYRIAHNLAVDRLRKRGKLEALEEQELAPV